MASTRNLNTLGDYKMEQKAYKDNLDYLTDKKNNYGLPEKVYFAGDGLLMGRIASESLSNNYCDVESFLRGIGSTNLVEPTSDIKPEINNYKSLDIMNRIPIIIPQPINVQKNQRPYMN
jgi:hypothetical protein